MNNLITLARILWAFQRRKIKCSHSPIRLWVESTNLCNLKCPMCANDAIAPKKKGFMKTDLYKRIIDEISGYAQDIYLHHRGEPLLHPDLCDMIKYANQKGLRTKLHTNATLLTEERSYKLLESGLNFISFSFDGGDKETYERVRVGANFDETLANITGFLQLKKKFGKTRPRTILQLLDIPGVKMGAAVKNEFRNRFHTLPLEEIRVIPAHNWAGNVELDQKTPNVSQSRRSCTFPWYSLTIFWDGTVVPCPQDFMGKIELGNARTETLREIWNNQKMTLLREKMAGGKYKDLKPCNTCDRIMRETIFGSMIPKQNLLTFLYENLRGYSPKKAHALYVQSKSNFGSQVTNNSISELKK